MTQEGLEVMFARLDARLQSLTELMEQRVGAIERDLQREVGRGEDEHRKIRDDIDAAFTGLRELQQWKSRVIGMAMGIGAVSGIASGSLVAALARGLGS